MSESLVKIYTFYYKSGSVLSIDKMYQPIMAGNTLNSDLATIPGDDTGGNISERNQYYSELTGIYWVWKNTRHEIVGTCHYRRFFTAQPEPFLYQLKRLIYYPLGLYKKRFGLIYTNNTHLFTSKILTEPELRFHLMRYDAILPVARKLKYTVEKHYMRYHDINDLILLKSVIHEKYPDFEGAFDAVLKGKRLYTNNMFVLKNELFQEFMSWWFDIIFEFERRVDLSAKVGYQKRVIGFIAERLLNVWIKQKRLNTVELPLIYFKRLKK
ncbi:MAG: DUF4422 domain-containing protein [Draconibacterium sp.]|nr:DUF4422 domain-containing protein [Draconibacterium sp.]